MTVSLQERQSLKEIFKPHKVSMACLARLTGKFSPNIVGWLGGYNSISRQAQQQLVEYAEPLRTQEAANGHQPVN
jgi:hypothetical protein